MYKPAEEKINQGLSPAARYILAFVAAFFGISLIITALSLEEIIDDQVIIGLLLMMVAAIFATSGRVRKFFGSSLGLTLFTFIAADILPKIAAAATFAELKNDKSFTAGLELMLMLGVPGLVYAIMAKFGFGRPKEPEEREDQPDEEE